MGKGSCPRSPGGGGLSSPSGKLRFSDAIPSPSSVETNWLAAPPSHKGQTPPHESFFKAIPTALESYSSQVVLLKAGEILLQRSKN